MDDRELSPELLSAVEDLVRRARDKGFVTMSELARTLTRDQAGGAALEAALHRLNDAGVSVVE